MAPPVHSTALALLAAVESAFGGEGRPLPERRYVADGSDVAWDCEQLVVAIEQIRLGLPGEPPRGYIDNAAMWTGVFAVWSVRCSPSLDEAGEAPDPEAITASAADLQDDASAMMVAAHQFAVACRRAATASLSFLGPFGGYAGAAMRIEVLLD